MLKRFFLFIALALASPALATAQDFEDYSEQSFEAALETGQPIVLNFYESWCSRCTIQRRYLRAALEDEAYADVIVLEAVHSEHRDFAKSLGINARTSLALIDGRELVAIEVGGISPKAIAALLSSLNI